MKEKIEKLDYDGRGITFVDGKITFVPKTLPEEMVELEIIEENKKYNIAKANVLSSSAKRIESKCPYFDHCGGCQFHHVKAEDELLIKKSSIQEQFERNLNYDEKIKVISNQLLRYRNKISLKVLDAKFGYYEERSHDFVEIQECLIVKDTINHLIKDLTFFKINSGYIIIRSNYNNEILVIIESEDKVTLNEDLLKKHRVIGVLQNNKLIYGQSFYYERLNGVIYKVSYNSFFQINLEIASKLFDYVNKLVKPNLRIIDLYCGAGTIGLQLAKNAKEIVGVEIVKNAVINGINNAKINKINNIKFSLGNVSDVFKKIKGNFDLIVVDPPRAGLDKGTIKTILQRKTKELIYISCNPKTLIRDLKELTSIYKIKEVQCFDMFFRTPNLETVVLLELKLNFS